MTAVSITIANDTATVQAMMTYSMEEMRDHLWFKSCLPNIDIDGKQ